MTQETMTKMGRSSRRGALHRLRVLQGIVESSKVDGLVLVAGIDGNFDKATAEVLAYLLQGKSGHELYETSLLDSNLEDVVFVLTPKTFKCFCPTRAHDGIVDLLACGIENSQIFKPSEEEEQDTDLLEEFKIGSFVQMVSGLRTVGLPCEDVKIVEAWPLIQSYGIEGVGKSGFFTMNFKTRSLFKEIHAVYPELDGQAFDLLVRQSLPMFMRHARELLSLVDRKSLGGLEELEEADLLEPFADYYSCRDIREEEAREATLFSPRLLAGQHTNSFGKTSLKAEESKPLCPGPQQESPIHFILELADPKTALACSRTYFLSGGRLREGGLYPSDEDLYEVDDFDEIKSRWSPADVLYLYRTYTCLVDAGAAAMEFFSTSGASASFKEVEASARRAFASALDSRKLEPLDPANLKFDLEEVDLAGNVFPATRGSKRLKRFKVFLGGLRTRDGGALLGSLAYGETFLDCSPAPKGFEVLSSAVPVVLTWPTLQAESIIQTFMSRMLTKISEESMVSSSENSRNEITGSLGKLVIDGSEEVTMLVSSAYQPSVKGEIFAFERGFVFYSPNALPIIVNLEKDVKSFTRYVVDQKNIMTTAILLFELEDASLTGFDSGSGNDTIGLALSSMEPSGCRYFNQKVWPLWMEILSSLPGGIRVATESGFPQELRDSHGYAASVRTKRLPDFMLSDEGCEDLTSHLDTNVRGVQLVRPQVAGENSTPIVVLVGIPGSGHEDLAGLLVKNARQGYEWSVVQQDLSTLLDAKEDSRCLRLEDAIENATSHESAGGERRGLLLPCIGYCDVPCFLELLSRTRQLRSGSCHVHSVVACVHTETLVRDGRSLYFEGVFEQLTQNHVKAVVIFGDEARTPALRRILKARLPGAKVVHSRDFSSDALIEPMVELPVASGQPHPSRGVLPDRHEMVFARTTCSILEDEGGLVGVFQRELDRSKEALLERPALMDEVYGARGRRVLLWAKAVYTCPREKRPVEISIVGGRARVVRGESERVCRAAPAPQVEWIFVGENVTEEYVRGLMGKCVQAPQDLRKLRNPVDLKASEKEIIKKEHVLDPLPDGYRFTGSSFVDCFGDHNELHPEFEKHAKQFLEKEWEETRKQNEEIERYNNKLEGLKMLDVNVVGR